MTIQAQVIADSISPTGKRITTLQLRYPRFIHAEFMTHRVFSRNASSSRAIPVEKMIEDLRRDPAMPVFWGSNKPGMQAGAELEEGSLTSPRLICQFVWLNQMELAIDAARRLLDNGLHKQIANRILEPWSHINVVVTATEWNNFFTLRCHKDAQPEMKSLADTIHDTIQDSIPDELKPGEWHLPYVDDEGDRLYDSQEDCLFQKHGIDLETAKKVSVARCARVSYLTHDGRKTSVEEDIALFERLVVSQPLHASPAEHQATPDKWILGAESNVLAETGHWENPDHHGNFVGWVQYRKTLPNENIPG